MPDRISEKIDNFVLAATAGTWLMIVGAAIALGKKAADFVYSATIGKFRLDIGNIFQEKIIPLENKVGELEAKVEEYKEEVHGYREQLHGRLALNETVLNQTVDVNNLAFEKLDHFTKLLNSKI